MAVPRITYERAFDRSSPKMAADTATDLSAPRIEQRYSGETNVDRVSSDERQAMM